MCGSSMLSCSLLLAAYECGNTSTAAVYDVSLTTVDTRALLRLERTMNLFGGREGGEGGREGGEGGREGGGGREGREGGREGGRGRREGREGGTEGGRRGREGREGGMTVIHILIGMFNINPMILQYLNNNLT